MKKGFVAVFICSVHLSNQVLGTPAATTTSSVAGTGEGRGQTTETVQGESHGASGVARSLEIPVDKALQALSLQPLRNGQRTGNPAGAKNPPANPDSDLYPRTKAFIRLLDSLLDPRKVASPEPYSSAQENPLQNRRAPQVVSKGMLANQGFLNLRQSPGDCLPLSICKAEASGKNFTIANAHWAEIAVPRTLCLTSKVFQDCCRSLCSSNLAGNLLPAGGDCSRSCSSTEPHLCKKSYYRSCCRSSCGSSCEDLAGEEFCRFLVARTPCAEKDRSYPDKAGGHFWPSSICHKTCSGCSESENF